MNLFYFFEEAGGIAAHRVVIYNNPRAQNRYRRKEMLLVDRFTRGTTSVNRPKDILVLESINHSLSSIT